VAKRNAILDAAQEAIATKGYEQMAIGELLAKLEMSSGAFYHYFDSKPALLLALVERIGLQAEQLVLPVVRDPGLPALEKLRRFFSVIGQHKRAHRRLVLAFLRVWYADENALFRHKLYVARVQRLAPLLEEVVRAGVDEGAFTTRHPDQTARMILALLEDVGHTVGALLLSKKRGAAAEIERISEAVSDAMERLLGAKPDSLRQAWREDLAEWLQLPEEFA
jgi:AcrR family transcriptional regulator